MPPTEADFALAAQYLQGPLLALFMAQHPRDIRHAANTARWLLERRHTERDLVTAALVHDVAKGQQRRRDRVAWVVAEWARLGRRIGAPGSRLEMRRAMARLAKHSEEGALLVSEAGASARVTTLTRLHHAPSRGDRMLALLQQADAAN
jgi:hypothetical protein